MKGFLLIVHALVAALAVGVSTVAANEGHAAGDIHANDAGYAVIAQAFLDVIQP